MEWVNRTFSNGTGMDGKKSLKFDQGLSYEEIMIIPQYEITNTNFTKTEDGQPLYFKIIPIFPFQFLKTPEIATLK